MTAIPARVSLFRYLPGFAIWHGGPGTKVFIDGRYDLGYTPAVVYRRDRSRESTQLADGICCVDATQDGIDAASNSDEVKIPVAF